MPSFPMTITFLVFWLGITSSADQSNSTTTGTATATKSSTTDTTTKPTTKPTTRNPNVNLTVCYKYVGCFDNFPPFDNANLYLPMSPEKCGTQFFLYTRQTPNKTEELDYKDPTPLQNSHFSARRPTKFIIHGFQNNNKTEWLYQLKDDFLFNGDYNVIIVAWGPGAKFPNYNQAVANTRMVATQVRLVIGTMLKMGAKLDDIHIVGHSLGAHTSGYAGRLLHGRVGRITGLDAAEPDFEKHPVPTRIDSSDAKFVDMIHTNGASIITGGAGLMQVSGHVDFYVDGGENQIGCDDLGGTLSGIFHLQFSKFSDRLACSHMRAIEYFQESLRNKNCPFTAFPCSSYDKYSRGECLSCGTTGCSQLGYYADQYNARGKMYVNTRSASPFCGFPYGYSLTTKGVSTKGQISIRLRGEYGQTEWFNITKTDESIPTNKALKGLVVARGEVGEVSAAEVRYTKAEGGFLWGGSGSDEWMAQSLEVESGESGQKYFFCLSGQRFETRKSYSVRRTSSRSSCLTN